jgi:heat shock protein HslJ
MSGRCLNESEYCCHRGEAVIALTARPVTITRMKSSKRCAAVRLGVTTVAAALAASLGACGTTSDGGAGGSAGQAPELTKEDLVGRWQADEPGDPHLQFSNNSSVTGTDGCNGIHTTYTVKDDTAELKSFYSTLKACEGVDDWLRGISSVTVDGDTMHVMDTEGKEIGTLQRVDSE